MTASLFVTEDTRVARLLAEEQLVFRNMETDATARISRRYAPATRPRPACCTVICFVISGA